MKKILLLQQDPGEDYASGINRKAYSGDSS